MTNSKQSEKPVYNLETALDLCMQGQCRVQNVESVIYILKKMIISWLGFPDLTCLNPTVYLLKRVGGGVGC